MTIFTASGVNLSISTNDHGQERLVVDRGIVRLYSNGTMQVVDRENQLICTVTMGTLSHMTKKTVKSRQGTFKKGRTRMVFDTKTTVVVGSFTTSVITLRMETADHNAFNDICKRSGVPYH